MTKFQFELFPLFDLIVFLFGVFHFDFHFSSRRAGSDKPMSVCNGGICIFIPLNKREMRSRAQGLLLCDRNHIIDWHTESCPSNSPRRARAASVLMETKAGWRQPGSMGKLSFFASLPVLFVSVCLSVMHIE